MASACSRAIAEVIREGAGFAAGLFEGGGVLSIGGNIAQIELGRKG